MYCIITDEIYDDLIIDFKRMEEISIIYLERYEKDWVNERIDKMIDDRFISFRREIVRYIIKSYICD
jgi:hypothetical protein